MKKLTVAAGSLAFAGYASAATVADSTGDTVTDVDTNLSLVSNPLGTGSPDTPFHFDATLFGDCACLEVNLVDNLVPGSIHTLSAQLTMDIHNNTGENWINFELNIQPECGTDSPNTDGLSFDQQNSIARELTSGVPLDGVDPVEVDEFGNRDFIRFNFQDPIAPGDSVTLSFPVATGANLAAINPFYLKLAYNIPEPSSVALMGLGFIGLFVRRRR